MPPVDEWKPKNIICQWGDGEGAGAGVGDAGYGAGAGYGYGEGSGLGEAGWGQAGPDAGAAAAGWGAGLGDYGVGQGYGLGTEGQAGWGVGDYGAFGGIGNYGVGAPDSIGAAGWGAPEGTTGYAPGDPTGGSPFGDTGWGMGGMGWGAPGDPGTAEGLSATDFGGIGTPGGIGWGSPGGVGNFGAYSAGPGPGDFGGLSGQGFGTGYGGGFGPGGPGQGWDAYSAPGGPAGPGQGIGYSPGSPDAPAGWAGGLGIGAAPGFGSPGYGYGSYGVAADQGFGLGPGYGVGAGLGWEGTVGDIGGPFGAPGGMFGAPAGIGVSPGAVAGPDAWGEAFGQTPGAPEGRGGKEAATGWEGVNPSGPFGGFEGLQGATPGSVAAGLGWAAGIGFGPVGGPDFGFGTVAGPDAFGPEGRGVSENYGPMGAPSPGNISPDAWTGPDPGQVGNVSPSAFDPGALEAGQYSFGPPANAVGNYDPGGLYGAVPGGRDVGFDTITGLTPGYVSNEPFGPANTFGPGVPGFEGIHGVAAPANVGNYDPGGLFGAVPGGRDVGFDTITGLTPGYVSNEPFGPANTFGPGVPGFEGIHGVAPPGAPPGFDPNVGIPAWTPDFAQPGLYSPTVGVPGVPAPGVPSQVPGNVPFSAPPNVAPEFAPARGEPGQVSNVAGKGPGGPYGDPGDINAGIPGAPFAQGLANQSLDALSAQYGRDAGLQALTAELGRDPGPGIPDPGLPGTTTPGTPAPGTPAAPNSAPEGQVQSTVASTYGPDAAAQVGAAVEAVAASLGVSPDAMGGYINNLVQAYGEIGAAKILVQMASSSAPGMA